MMSPPPTPASPHTYNSTSTSWQVCVCHGVAENSTKLSKPFTVYHTACLSQISPTNGRVRHPSESESGNSVASTTEWAVSTTTVVSKPPLSTKLTNVESNNGKSTNGKLANGKSANGKSVNGKSAGDKSANRNSADGKLTNGKLTNGKLTNGKLGSCATNSQNQPCKKRRKKKRKREVLMSETTVNGHVTDSADEPKKKKKQKKQRDDLPQSDGVTGHLYKTNSSEVNGCSPLNGVSDCLPSPDTCALTNGHVDSSKQKKEQKKELKKKQQRKREY